MPPARWWEWGKLLAEHRARKRRARAEDQQRQMGEAVNRRILRAKQLADLRRARVMKLAERLYLTRMHAQFLAGNSNDEPNFAAIWHEAVEIADRLEAQRALDEAHWLSDEWRRGER